MIDIKDFDAVKRHVALSKRSLEAYEKARLAAWARHVKRCSESIDTLSPAAQKLLEAYEDSGNPTGSATGNGAGSSDVNESASPASSPAGEPEALPAWLDTPKQGAPALVVDDDAERMTGRARGARR